MTGSGREGTTIHGDVIKIGGVTTTSGGVTSIGGHNNSTAGSRTVSYAITEGTSREDVKAAIAQAIDQIQRLPGLEPAAREKATAALTDAADVEQPSQEHKGLKDRLDTVGATLTSAQNLGESALTLGKFLLKVGLWVAALL